MIQTVLQATAVNVSLSFGAKTVDSVSQRITLHYVQYVVFTGEQRETSNSHITLRNKPHRQTLCD